MPPKGKSKNTAKGKGRGQGRPVLRAPSPFAVSGTEKDPAAQKTEPDTAEVHDPQDEGLFEAGGTEGPCQGNASSPSHLVPDARCQRVIPGYILLNIHECLPRLFRGEY